MKEEPRNYQSTHSIVKPQVLHPLASAFLLCYLGAYFFLGCFNPLLDRYCLVGELFHLDIASLPVGSLVNGLNPSAIIHHLGRLIPSGWVPDTDFPSNLIQLMRSTFWGSFKYGNEREEK
ncbi:hypothetical protein DSO57_1001544, partial [Entomophthora muscae]